jgi:hypothetical protein
MGEAMQQGVLGEKAAQKGRGRMWEIILDAVDCQSLQCLLTVRVQDRNTALLSHGGLGRHQKYDFVPNDVVDLKSQGVEQHLGVGIAFDVVNGLVHFLGQRLELLDADDSIQFARDLGLFGTYGRGGAGGLHPDGRFQHMVDVAEVLFLFFAPQFADFFHPFQLSGGAGFEDGIQPIPQSFLPSFFRVLQLLEGFPIIAIGDPRDLLGDGGGGLLLVDQGRFDCCSGKHR